MLGDMELNGVPATIDQVKALALTNYGHFTSMLVHDNRVRGLSLHLERLARDCQQLFNVELDTDAVRQFVRHALAESSGPATARVTVYDPALDLGTIGRDAQPHILVTTRSASLEVSPPVRLQAVAYHREIPAVKHIGLFGAMMRRRAAQREGFDDVLFINPDGTVSEIATSNVGFIRGDQIVWPRSEWLTGITMTLIHQALDEPIVMEPVKLSDLPDMDAVFATNAATGIRAVASVDDVKWPTDHKALAEVRALYDEVPSELL